MAKPSQARIQTEQTMLLIARKRQQQLEAEELAEQQRLFLAKPPHRVHYIGPTPRPWPKDERSDEEFAAEVQAYIDTFDSYEQYQAANRRITQRLVPGIYAIQMEQEHKRRHPDPDEPPF